MEVTILGIIVSTTECQKLIIFGTFISPIYTFSLVGDLIVYTKNQGTNREIFFIKYEVKVKIPTLARNKQVFQSSLTS